MRKTGVYSGLNFKSYHDFHGTKLFIYTAIIDVIKSKANILFSNVSFEMYNCIAGVLTSALEKAGAHLDDRCHFKKRCSFCTVYIIILLLKNIFC